MTAHAVDSLQLEPGQSVLGDRAFVFAFGNAEVIGEHGWVSKRQSVTLLNTPYLALVEAGWDPDDRVLSVSLRGQSKSAQVDDPAARVEIAEWFTDLVLGLPENPLCAAAPNENRCVCSATARAASPTAGPPRFRSEPHHPWPISPSTPESRSTSAASGSTSRLMTSTPGARWIGSASRSRSDRMSSIEVTAPIQRCNAINASPVGAGRDVELMRVLQHSYGHLNFGIEANVLEGGRISVGDELAIG